MSSLPALVALFAALGCSSTTEPGRPAERTALPRPLTSAERAVIDAGNDFSWALLRQLSAEQRGTTVVVSPLSASMALGMTLNGAAGPTFDGMRATLGLGAAPLADINAGYKASIALLRDLDPTVDFRLANSIWHDARFPFHQSFLDAGRQWFDAEIRAVDFASPAAAASMNDWVKQATGGRIPSIVESTRDEVMYLINTIYFKGKWRDEFDPAKTRDGEFRAADGSRQAAKLMHRSGSIPYVADAEVVGATLPYGNAAFAMTILMPRDAATSIDAFAEGLTAAKWRQWTEGMRPSGMDLDLPRFTITYERKLNDDLAALGMADAFSPARADFSRLSPQGVFLSVVKQKTFIQVNEEGTEAAAATAVGVTPTSLPPTFRVDRPFVFVIHERLSGTVLFVGKVAKL
ncbi:MAG TPA: serpin family protein [Gemmatimonadaceae bacterium]|nr:serpin family protein [Gemmatimonadaceae bacterium]